jgi:hypothetical protein
MMRLSAPTVLVPTWLLVVAALVAAPAAWACTSDPECDDGVACSIPDACVAGECVAGGGGDSDADGLCDADDDSDLPLSATKITMRRDTTRPGLDNSSVKANGFFITAPPSDVFDPLAGFTVRAREALGTDVSRTYLPIDCVQTPSRVKCKSVDKTLRAVFKPVPLTPQVFQFKLKMKNFGLEGPFLEPVTLSITQTGSVVDRSGTVSDCVLTKVGIKCREF